jgi:hypothetical protein
MGVQKAGQELGLYLRAGEICGFRNHPNTQAFAQVLRQINRQAFEMGMASAGYMIDGMLAPVGKNRICVEAAPGRAGHDRMFESFNR